MTTSTKIIALRNRACHKPLFGKEGQGEIFIFAKRVCRNPRKRADVMLSEAKHLAFS